MDTSNLLHPYIEFTFKGVIEGCYIYISNCNKVRLTIDYDNGFHSDALSYEDVVNCFQAIKLSVI